MYATKKILCGAIPLFLLIGCAFIYPTFMPLAPQDKGSELALPMPADTLSELIVNLSDEDPLVRVSSAYALEAFGEEPIVAIPALKRNLYHADNEVRRSSVIALGKLGRAATDAVSDLIQIMDNDSDFHVTDSAARALGEIGDTRAVPDLIENVYDDSDDFYTLAITSSEAVGKLTGQHFTNAGEGGYTSNDDGVPLIVIDVRNWWEHEGQYKNWNN